jgi:CheY-like chemotaxis protein
MRKILLAEDDPFILDIYSTYLKKEGYGVDIAKDGQMALEKIKISKPDILLLDLDLPKLNGRDVLKVLRSEPSTKDLKVMIISNHNQQDYPDVVSQLGIIKYFLKIETTVQDIARAIEEALK